MPASATITSFYTFTANTKARASEVNTNFSNFRGHSIPIDPNTTTAIDNTYDLGSTSWRWRNAYVVQPIVNSVYFNGQTTTSSPVLKAQTSVTAGAFEILLGAVTVGVFNATGMPAHWLNNLSITDTKIASNAVTTAKIDDLAVTSAKLGTGSVIAAKLTTGANEIDWVLERYADSSWRDIGTYHMFFYGDIATLLSGGLVSGADLYYDNQNTPAIAMTLSGARISSPSGTWRNVGATAIHADSVGSAAPNGLFLRVT